MASYEHNYYVVEQHCVLDGMQGLSPVICPGSTYLQYCVLRRSTLCLSVYAKATEH